MKEITSHVRTRSPVSPNRSTWAHRFKAFTSPRFFRSYQKKFKKVGPTRFLNGLALRTTSSFLCNIQCQPPTVEQHSPPPSLFLPRRPTHNLQDDQANKEGRCYVCIALQLKTRAMTANKFAAVNTVPGKFHDENPISEAYRQRFPSALFRKATRGSLPGPDNCFKGRRWTRVRTS